MLLEGNCADSQIAGIEFGAPCQPQPALIGLYSVNVDPPCQPNLYLRTPFETFP